LNEKDKNVSPRKQIGEESNFPDCPYLFLFIYFLQIWLNTSADVCREFGDEEKDLFSANCFFTNTQPQKSLGWSTSTAHEYIYFT